MKKEKYLGLPTIMGKNRNSSFNSIKERIKKRICGWSERFLSKAGKEVLIKSVLQAIPSYMMSVFRLTRGFCNNLNSYISKFWWHNGRNSKGINWRSWNFMCQSKHRGGMGFRHLEAYNRAMVAKQAWRLMKFPNLLITKIFKAKYHQNTEFLSATATASSSYVWKGLIWARAVIEKGSRWLIGNGKRTKVYWDRWLPNETTFRVITPIRLDREALVVDLINQNGKWKEELIREHFIENDCESILKLPTTNLDIEDELIWSYTGDGMYTVKSGYQTAVELMQAEKKIQVAESSNRNKEELFWKQLWKIDVPENVKSILWRAANEILPTNQMLNNRYVPVDPRCPFCRSFETANHAIWECKHLRKVWNQIECSRPVPQGKGMKFINTLEFILMNLKQPLIENMAMIMWEVWKERNNIVHGRQKREVETLIRRAQSQLTEYKKSREAKCIFNPHSEQHNQMMHLLDSYMLRII